MKPFNVGDIAVGQNFAHATFRNGMECEIVKGLEVRKGRLVHNGVKINEPMYMAKWADGELTGVLPAYLRRKPSRSDDAWLMQKMNQILNPQNLDADVLAVGCI